MLFCDQRNPKKDGRPEAGAGEAGAEYHQPVQEAAERWLWQQGDPCSLFFRNSLPFASFLLHCYLLAPMWDLLLRTRHIFIDSNEMYIPPKNLGISYLKTTTKKTSQEQICRNIIISQGLAGLQSPLYKVIDKLRCQGPHKGRK